MKSIVLAEKPSVARELARVLGCTRKTAHSIEGPVYIVTWALGHLVTLAEPHDYDSKLSEWRLEDLPMLPEQMKLKVLKGAAKQYFAVQEILRRKDVGDLIIATDAGREGELVARWIMKLAGWKKPFKRLWISSQTDQAIKQGFQKLKPGHDYDRLYEAASCRAEADWLIGLNITRALACKYNAQLSAGRVQTPTLAMIVNREDEIKHFKPVDYWSLTAQFEDYNGIWRDQNGNSRLFDKSKAEALKAKIDHKAGQITSVESKEVSESAPMAYDLTELQRDANRRLGFSAQKTLSVLQALYENHKIVTYPRTDSRAITKDIVPTLPDRLKAMAVGPYAETARKILSKPLKMSPKFVDDSAVRDHHAVIPTEEPPHLSSLSHEENQLYDLIARRFLAQFMPPYTALKTTIVTTIAGENFYSSGRTVKNQGWKILNTSAGDTEKRNDEALSEQELKPVTKGLPRTVIKTKLDMLKTRPPARYTEATLLSAMESPGKFIEDSELRQSFKEGGLGTPATRAEIIEKLISSQYIERQGKELHPTGKGFQLIGLVPENLRSPALTAAWEKRLTAISEGSESGKAFMQAIRQNAAELVAMVKSDTAVYKADNLTKMKCPECGEPMLLINGRHGKRYLCSSRTCGHKEDEKSRESDSYKRSKREAGMDRRLIQKYSTPETPVVNTFGALLKDALSKKADESKEVKEK